MKSSSPLLWVIITALCLAVLDPPGIVCAEKIREAAKAGSWYPADPGRIREDIAALTRQAEKSRLKIPARKRLRALILPHAGYRYSGWTAAHAAFVLSGRQFSKVILLGPDHYVGLRNGAISDVDAYQTPLGVVNLHPDAYKLRNRSELFQSSSVSDRNEHSLEMVLLFLQYYLGDFELIPIVAGPTQTGRFAESLKSVIDDNTLLVVSSDLSHFLSYSEAVEKDKQTIDWIMNRDASGFASRENHACGAIPLSILIHIAKQHNWQPVLLHYSNSGDTSGDRARVVGYAAIAFFGDQPMQSKATSNRQFSEKQGQVLVQLVRQTLMQEMGKSVPQDESQSLKKSLRDQSYDSYCGTFVTLKIDDQLRGCIGNLTANEPLSEGVRRNAINAAFHDPRFPPLTERELEKVDIEVSILTEPQPLEYVDGEDLLAKLRVNIDGVIIRKGQASATFLPQVWEQLSDPEDFLEHLCMKAGLSSNAWRNSKLDVSTYQVQYFEEPE
jgi:AmmeMemoRadiSam system protein B/AmmeMemoRadiSam system protein A